MKKDFRRTLAASGWLDIAVLVVTVAVIVALNRACESDMIGEMLNAFMSKIPSGSGNEPNYGGFLMGFLSIFIVLGWILLLPVIGVACAGLGISFMIECKNETKISRLVFRASGNILPELAAFVLDAALLAFMIWLLYAGWLPVERAVMLGLCAVLLGCPIVSAALKGILLSRRKKQITPLPADPFG